MDRLSLIEERLARLEAQTLSLSLCVQCGKEFSPLSPPCRFHEEPNCKCSTPQGCRSARHSSHHHVAFPYALHRAWAASLAVTEEFFREGDLVVGRLAERAGLDGVPAVDADHHSPLVLLRAGSKAMVFVGRVPEGTELGRLRASADGWIAVDGKHVVQLNHDGSWLAFPEAKKVEDREVEASAPQPLPEDVCENAVAERPAAAVAKSHKQVGDALLVKGRPVEVSSTFGRDGSFDQLIRTTLTVTNPHDGKTVLLTGVSSSALGVASCSTRIGNEEDFVPVKLGPFESVQLAVCCVIPVKGQCGSDNWERARVHASLPQPLCVTWAVEAMGLGEVTLCLEQVNQGRTRVSLDERKEAWGVGPEGWLKVVEVDDATDRRDPETHCAGAFFGKDDGLLHLRSSLSGSYRTIDDAEIKPGAELINETGFSVHAVSRDVLRMKLATATGSITTHFRLPPRATASIKARREGDDLVVDFSFPRRGSSQDWIGVFTNRFSPSAKYFAYTSTDGAQSGQARISCPDQPSTISIRSFQRGSYTPSAKCEL